MKVKRRHLFIIFALTALVPVAQAGPPFVTDDPEPVDYQHWEVYVASQGLHDSSGGTFSLPQIEVNYGAAPNLQLHVIAMTALNGRPGQPAPTAIARPNLEPSTGCGRNRGRSRKLPFFPLVEVPGGESSRGLGSAHTPVYLPLWMQKTFGKWTSYGGGGYWFNPGAGNRNYSFLGILVQRQVRDNLAIGVEFFHQTSQLVGARAQTNSNLGFIWDLNETEHVMASAGPVLQGGPATRPTLPSN